MRCHLIALLCALTIPAAAFAQADDGTILPEVAVRSSDYRADRAGFHTRLRQPGPSPQRVEMPVAPAGISEIRYPSDGLSLRAWVGQPQGKATKPAAVVIFLHGGFAFGAEDFEMAAPYREAGFAVVTPILRGENGQPGNYSLFYDEVEDVIAVTDWVRRQPWADGTHIYLAGHSAGGTLALLTAMASDGYRAVASFSGSPDQIIFTRVGLPPRAVPFDASDTQETAMRSPLAYAASLKAPARFYFGSREPHFRLSTLRMADAARAAGRDAAAQEVTGGHMDAVPAEIAASIAFFKSLW